MLCEAGRGVKATGVPVLIGSFSVSEAACCWSKRRRRYLTITTETIPTEIGRRCSQAPILYDWDESKPCPLVSAAPQKTQILRQTMNTCICATIKGLRTRATLSHVFYMAICIIERNEFLREFILFPSQTKELFNSLMFPISSVIFLFV